MHVPRLRIQRGSTTLHMPQDDTVLIGGTPLHQAARHGHWECVEALLAAGADKDKAKNYVSRAWSHGHSRAACVRAMPRTCCRANRARAIVLTHSHPPLSPRTRDAAPGACGPVA